MSMFAMPQHTYVYGAAPAAPARHYSAHGTSSAFSSSAHPDEDWTKISDLAERRRIQNRIAQRNYRKKLKRRLEDLERRAGSSDEGESEKQPQASSPAKSKRQSISKIQTQKTSPRPAPSKPVTIAQHGQFTPPMDNSEEMVFASVFETRERSNTPPMFSYPSYPAPDELLLDPYASAQPYPAMSAADAYPNYLAAATTMAASLPAMSSYSDPMKAVDDGMYLNYGFVAGAEMSIPSHYDSASAQTPPLSHSYEHSTSCSDNGYEYPTTPLSMPGSPGVMQPQQ